MNTLAALWSHPHAWVAFSLIANFVIIATETINRGAVGGWATVLVRTVPLIFVAQYALFRSFNGAPHFMLAWVVFTLGNSIVRIGAVRLFGLGTVESWPLLLCGVAVMFGGAYLLKEGLG